MQNDADKTSSNGNADTSPAVSRRSFAEYANTSTALDRIRRMMPPREKAIDAMKTLFWVVPLTLIIWIYAEQEQVLQTPASVGNVQVQIKMNDGRYVAVVGSSDPTVATVLLKLSGPQEAVARVREALTTIGRVPLIAYLDGRPNEDNQRVNVVEVIQDQDTFRKNGVTVKESIPAEITVNIDKMAHQSLAVQLPPNVTDISPSSTFDPPRVDVSGPEKLLTPMVNSGELKVYANLDGLQEERKHPGEHPNLTVPIGLSMVQPELRLGTIQVKATIKVLKSDVQAEITGVPIEVLLPPGMVGQYGLTLTAGESIQTVHISGPQQDIDALKNFVPKAILEILPPDAYSDVHSKPVRFELPPNIKVSPDDAAIQYEFKLTKLTQRE